MIDHIITYERSAHVEDEMTGTTLGVWDDGTWIDIGNHEIVRLSEIEAIAPFDARTMTVEFNNLTPEGAVVLSLVRVKGGDTLASSLTWREWRSRLRKANNAIL